MWQDFKTFIAQGNVMELAVAVVIGAAFGKIVTSLVDQVIMPLVGILLTGINFSNLSYKVGNAEVMYGEFIQSIVDFFIIAMAVFLFVRMLNKLKRKEEETAEESEIDEKEELLKEIRDLLKYEKK
ncbi:large-conductance mechanosensitive channel protein MscL [Lentibacillus sp. N15]|uniref:large-conductance mechanosensitive channel protein MscL n=1 Tax=Lentibacillus songyuanensis TaxID=3136161 RepID=UPI0031BBB6A3